MSRQDTVSSFFVCPQSYVLADKGRRVSASAKAACVFGETGYTPTFVVFCTEDKTE